MGRVERDAGVRTRRGWDGFCERALGYGFGLSAILEIETGIEVDDVAHSYLFSPLLFFPFLFSLFFPLSL